MIQDAIDFLKKYAPEGAWVLTSIDPNKRGIQTRTFYPSDEPVLLDWLAQNNGERNIYFHVNKTIRDLQKKAEREDIENMGWLHVDIDPKAGEDIVQEQERALALLKNPPGNVPAPTVIVFSGGGYQGFWKLREPVQINGDLGKAEDAKRYNMQLEVLFGADNCHNIDRIMRLPGTMNVPDARKRKKGRVAVEAKLVEFNSDLVYDITQFTPAQAVQLASDSGFGGSSTVKISGNIKRLDSVEELDCPDRIKVIIVQGRHPDEGAKAGDDSRSAWLFDAICGMVRADVPDDVIFSVVTDPDFRISDSVLDKGTAAERYALRQIERAKEESIDPNLRILNEKHAVISNMGGRCRVVEEVMDFALNRTRITKQSFEDFRNRYMHKSVQIGTDSKGNPQFMQMGKWWLQHPNRKQYDTIVFAPGKEVPSAFNLWKGFAVEARPGNLHQKYLKHILDNVCSGDQSHFDYTIGWMASAVQKPDSPGQTAIVLRGRQGTGKSFFIKMFGRLFGRHYMQVSDPKHLVGSFNSHLRDCVVLFGDEAFYAGDKKHESVLKTLITEETITIEAKGVDAEAAMNCTHVLLASNNSWVVPAGVDERRYFVLDVGDHQMQNSGYFEEIAKELENGGLGNLLFYLTQYDLSKFNVRNVPKTAALREQKLYTLSPEEEWWYNKLQEGRLNQESEVWESDIQKDTLFLDYVEHQKLVGIFRRATPTTLGKFLAKVCPEGYPKSLQKLITVKIPDGQGWSKEVKRRPYFYQFPDLETLRSHWDTHFQTGEAWQQVSQEPVHQQTIHQGEPF
jgi:hypothetical protein